MLFNLILFYLIVCIDRLLSHPPEESHFGKECLVTLQMESGESVCPNDDCFVNTNPLNVIQSLHDNGKRCYLHFLQLAFTSYENLIHFINTQAQSRTPVERFFARDRQTRLIEV